MANQNTIEIRLTVKDDGTVVVQQFGKNAESSLGKADKATKSASDTLDTMKKGWLEVTAVAAVAGLAFYKALEYMDLGAKALQAEVTYESMTRSIGADSAVMLTAIQQASASTIDESKSMQKAVFALDQEIDPNKLPQLFEAARIAARKTSVDVEQAAGRILDACATQMPRGLKVMGVITKEQMDLFTRAFAAGRTDVALLDFVLANANVTIARTGGLSEDAAEHVQQLKAALYDLKESASKKLVQDLDDIYLILKKFADTDAAKVIGAIAKGFMGTPYKKPKEPEWTVDITSMGVDIKLAKALADRKALEDKEKAKNAAIKIAEDEAKNQKAIDDFGLKDYENVTKTKEALMKGSYASELEIARYNLDRQMGMDDLAYQNRITQINLEAKALFLKDKYFDRQAYVAGQMKVLDADRMARLSAENVAIENTIQTQDKYRREAAAASGYADQKQMADLAEYRRRGMGAIVVIDQTAWDQCAEYHRLTGEVIQKDQIQYIAAMLIEYKETLVGGVKSALMEIQDEYENTGKLMGDFTRRTFDSMADTLAENTMKMSWDFTNLANSVIKDLLRIFYKQQILGPLSGAAQGWLSGLFGGGSATPGYQPEGWSFGTGSAAWGVAKGAIFQNGNIIPFGRGDIITRPTIFSMANGNIGLVGEAGWEGILPLGRTPRGDLGVKTIGSHAQSAPQSVAVHIINESGQNMKATKSQATFDMQRMVVSVWIDALDRNVGGLQDRLGK